MEKEKAQVTWLQCTLPKTEWDKLNARRLVLGLKWADIVVPAVMEYLPKLEAAVKAKPPAKNTMTPTHGMDPVQGKGKKAPGKKAPAKADKPLVAIAKASKKAPAQAKVVNPDDPPAPAASKLGERMALTPGEQEELAKTKALAAEGNKVIGAAHEAAKKTQTLGK
jgi:hypothetical protein